MITLKQIGVDRHTLSTYQAAQSSNVIFSSGTNSRITRLSHLEVEMANEI